MITDTGFMAMHGQDHRLQQAPAIDARSLRVECPQHKGLLIPVTGLRISRVGAGKGNGLRMYMEALCIHCNRYQYFKVQEGASLEPFKWNE